MRTGSGPHLQALTSTPRGKEGDEAISIFLQQLSNGLLVGSFYALVALGYSIVYGVVRLINFAHGDLFMVGSFVGYSVLVVAAGLKLGSSTLGVVLAFLVATVTIGLLGLVVERLAYRPLRKARGLSLLITAVGVSLVLENGVMVTWGTSFRTFPVSLPGSGFDVLGVHISIVQVALFALSMGLMAALNGFVQKTKLGRAMRAVSIDQDAARLMGINPDTIIAIAFALGSALAGAAGVMVGIYYGQASFMMGFILGLKAFTAAVLGGVGNIPGAVVGGLLLGILEAMGAAYVGSQWKDVVVFAVLIATLVAKPTGLLGERVVERM